MAYNLAVLPITIDGTGTEIPTLSVTSNFDIYEITGSATATGNYALVASGSPQLGTTYFFDYQATLDITTNSKTFSIFGVALTQTQLNSKLEITCRYNGSAWKVKIIGSLDQAVIDGNINIVASSITTGDIANLAVTNAKIANTTIANAKLATMANLTVKANVSGGVAVPSDVAISSLVPYGGWGLLGNSGTTAGTNFIGTTDAVDLVFKVNGIFSGWIDWGTTNTSFGLASMAVISTGAANASFGEAALGSLTTGNANAAFGISSLGVTSGSANVGVGRSAGYSISTGSNNVAVGNLSAFNLTTGSSNTIIGQQSDVNSSASLNRIALGKDALADADYQFALPDLVTKVKWASVHYTLPSGLPGVTSKLACSPAGVLYWTNI